MTFRLEICSVRTHQIFLMYMDWEKQGFELFKKRACIGSHP
jgi:hypothetical protein